MIPTPDVHSLVRDEHVQPIRGASIDASIAAMGLPATTVDAEQEEVAAFDASLNEALDDLSRASDESGEAFRRIGELSEELKKRDFFGSLVATFSAKTDKELAIQVRALASSLQTTQSVLKVILKIEVRENRLLDSFNRAVVEKIEKIVSDTAVLRGDQNSAALAFLKMVHARINEHRHLQAQVQQHSGQLESLPAWQDRVERSLTLVSKDVLALSDGSDVVRAKLDSTNDRLHECEVWIRSEAQQIEETSLRLLNQQERILRLEELNVALRVELSRALCDVQALEASILSRDSLRARMMRYAPASFAVALAAYVFFAK